MFYSLQEAAERLNKTEHELRDIVKAGRLREFRDGPNLLFKVDEVEALVVAEGVPIRVEGLEPEGSPELEMLEAEAPEPEAFEPTAGEDEIPLELEAPQEFEPSEADFEIPDAQGPQTETPELEIPEFDLPELEPPMPLEPQAGTSEILLAPETGAPLPPSELTNADTAITGEGVSVLGETDKDYEVTDDTLGETMGTLGLGATGTKSGAGTTGGTGTTPEASLEEIEGDVNLDSFGSGSGLLDLSLQADDTSLGGILDEIYTAEEEAVEPADAGTVEDVAAEAEQMVSEDELVAPQAGLDMAALAQARFEPAPDKASNILGAMLILPSLLAVYTFALALSGLFCFTPSILTPIKGFLWYIVGGLIVLSLAVSGYAFTADRESAPKAQKAKKEQPKKEKREKPKAPKKAKK
jgi:hypothetical protein